MTEDSLDFITMKNMWDKQEFWHLTGPQFTSVALSLLNFCVHYSFFLCAMYDQTLAEYLIIIWYSDICQLFLLRARHLQEQYFYSMINTLYKTLVVSVQLGKALVLGSSLPKVVVVAVGGGSWKAKLIKVMTKHSEAENGTEPALAVFLTFFLT